MTEHVDHWQALFDQTYLRWFDLQGQPSLCEIVSVHARVELTLPGGAKSRKPVVFLKQVQGKIENAKDEDGKPLATTKPLVLNATNGASIADIHGVRPSTWMGCQIVLYQDSTRMWSPSAKKMIDTPCIRIRAAKTT